MPPKLVAGGAASGIGRLMSFDRQEYRIASEVRLAALIAAAMSPARISDLEMMKARRSNGRGHLRGGTKQTNVGLLGRLSN
jgi:hypothetical protein